MDSEKLIRSLKDDRPGGMIRTLDNVLGVRMNRKYGF